MTDASKPLFGKYMRPIHPFDMYELVNTKSQETMLASKIVGTTGIPVMQEDGQCYLSEARILELDGQLYLQTATVPAVTKSIV